VRSGDEGFASRKNRDRQWHSPEILLSRVLEIAVRTTFCLWLTFLWFLVAPLAGQEIPPELLDDDHVREEFGVNQFTAPSIAKVLDELRRFQPIDYAELARPFPEAVAPARPQLALNFGVLIADGCLIVEAEQTAPVQDYGRALLRLATSLALRDEVARHSKSMMVLAENGQWPELERELAATQREVERAMVRYRDEEVAHLISAGGWLRGIEILSGALEAEYSKEKAAGLLRLDVLDYFIERMELFRGNTGRNAAVQECLSAFRTVRSLLGDADGNPPTLETTREINRITGAAIKMIETMPSR